MTRNAPPANAGRRGALTGCPKGTQAAGSCLAGVHRRTTGSCREEAAISDKEPRKEQKTAPRDRRDKPADQEADKDIKEGGIAGARREQGKREEE